MLRHFFSKAALACLLVSVTFNPFTTRAQSVSSDTKLPVDSKVTIGKLSNGLTYYIRPNNKPEKKVELRLIVNAGSILEDDDQQGLAHFMEHMNFNGTKNYPKNKLVDFLQSLGVEFGADLNAYTSFDETVYILPIPTDKPGNIESGFQVLSDWAHNANLTEEDINSERGVVLEESRGGKGANDRMMKQYLPKLLAGSQYANRLPIGKDDILKNFKPEVLRKFYQDWYRPDLMAVAVVGDITVPQAEALIKKYFSDIKNPKNPRERKAFDVKPYDDATTMVVTDKEAPNYLFQLLFSARKAQKSTTVGDYRSDLVKEIFFSLLNRRLQELTQSATPPFAFAYTQNNSFARDYENFTLIVVPATDIQTATNAAIGELVKAQEYGFHNSELEIVKKQMLNGMEKAYNERNTTESGKIVAEYVRHFLTQESIPGIEQEYQYVQEFLLGITIQEINAEAKKWLNKEDNKEYFALVLGPSAGTQMKLPTDVELKTIINTAFDQKPAANEEKSVAENLLEKEPVAGKIVSETTDKELAVTTYTLSNGVKVSVKKTDFKSDEIVLSAVKKGGINNYDVSYKASAQFLPDIIESMGYGQFTPRELSDAISGKTLRLVPQINEISAQLSGSSSVKDLESLLQLTHLQLTEPRRDEDLFTGFVNKIKMQLMTLSNNPQIAFIDTLVKALYNNDPRHPIQIPTVNDLEKIDLNKVLEIYKNEFSNADGFHFFVVGNVDQENLKPLLEKYIASLPAKGTVPSFKDNGLRTVQGNKTLKFAKGQEQQSLVLLQHSGQIPFDEQTALEVDMIGELLSIKVIEDIREEMGAMYSGGFSGSMLRDPYPQYTISGQFPCGPENVDAIIEKIKEQIAQIKKEGPSQKDLDKVKSAKTEKRRESLKTNGYWSNKLESLLFWNYSKNRFFEMDNLINKITIADIKNTANKVFDGKNSFTAILYPETLEAAKDQSSSEKQPGVQK